MTAATSCRTSPSAGGRARVCQFAVLHGPMGNSSIPSDWTTAKKPSAAEVPRICGIRQRIGFALTSVRSGDGHDGNVVE